MNQSTTTKLHLSLRDRYFRHERTIRDGLIGAWMATALLLIWTLLRPVEAPQAPLVKISQVAPAILVMTATAAPPLPTATPWPTALPKVIIQQAEPVTVYVPVETQPTMPPMEAPTDSFTAPLIDDSNPEGLACTNPATGITSPLCGGITNQEARDAVNAQQHNGGSGISAAPNFGAIPSASGDSAAQWCAGAAASGVARCTGR